MPTDEFGDKWAWYVLPTTSYLFFSPIAFSQSSSNSLLIGKANAHKPLLVNPAFGGTDPQNANILIDS